jgi:hypothetical protein
MKTYFYLMSNDCKWLERTQELSFTPYPGMTFDGLAAEQPLKISGMAYDVAGDFFKIRLAWLSAEPMVAADLLALGVGWEVKGRASETATGSGTGS